MPHQCLKCGSLFAEGSTTILRGCPDCHGTRFFYTQDALTGSERDQLLAKSERDLRGVIEGLVKEAHEGTLKPEALDWIKVEKPQPATAEPAEPPAVPSSPSPPERPRGQAQFLPGNKLLIKLPPRSKRARGRQPTPLRWDYAPPEPPAPSLREIPASASNVIYTRSPAPEPGPAWNAPVAPPAGPTGPVPSVPPTPLREVPSSPALGESAPETIRIQKPGLYEIDVKRLMEDSPVIIQKDGTYLIHLPSLFEASPKLQR